MVLNIFNKTKQPQWTEYQPLFEHLMVKTLQVLQRPDTSAVSVIFVGPRKIHQINRDYRNIDRPTDVISFALSDDALIDPDDYVEAELGDIFINTKACINQASEYHHSVKREACFLFVHGLLHLCGFDHQTPKQEKEMIGWQKKILDDVVGPDDVD